MRVRLKLRLLGGLLLVLLGIGWFAIGEDDIRDTTYPAPDMYETHVPLFKSRTVGQTFRAEANHLSAIGLHLVPYTQKQPSGRVTLHLKSSPDETADLRRAVIPALAVKKDIEERFLFDPLPDSAGKTFYLELEFPDGGADQAVGVRFAAAENPERRDYGAGERYLERQPAGGDLGFSLYHREHPILGVQLAGGLIIAGLALLVSVLQVPRRLPWFSPQTLALVIILAGLPLLSFLPLFRNIEFLGREHWNPVMVASPFSLQAALLPWFGPIVGTKVSMALHGVIGFIGFFFLLRKHRTSTLASLLGAATFSFSSFFPLHFAYGHTEIAALAWLPWLLLFAHSGLTDHRFLAPTVLATGLLIVEGGTELALPALLFVLMLITGTVLFSPRRTREQIIVLLAVLLLMMAARIIPLPNRTTQSDTRDAPSGLRASQVNASPRAPQGEESEVGHPYGFAERILRGPQGRPGGAHSFPARLPIDVFLDPRQVGFAEKFPRQPLPWVEYGAYVGIFPLALGALGVLRHPINRLSLVIPGAFFALITFSPRAQELLGPLLFFDDPHLAQRSVAFVVFALGVLAAHGFDVLRRLTDIPELSRSRGIRRVTLGAFALLSFMVVADLLVVSAPVYLTAFIVPPTPVTIAAARWSSEVTLGLSLTVIGLLSSLILWTRRLSSGMLRAS